MDTNVACNALLDPHLAIAKLLPEISDEQALRLIKRNYSELVTWLTQKSDATAEGDISNAKGSLGPKRELTPSRFLFGTDNVEVNRTSVGFLALKWILANDYVAFTSNQSESSKLSKASFAQLRGYVTSVLKTPTDIDAMIVMILTNDLGKVKRYHELIERATQQVIVDHDQLLFVGFSKWPETSPNFLRLPNKQKYWILRGLRLGSSLNIGQFARAENLPASLKGVELLKNKPLAFEFKFVELLLDVAGAHGHLDSGGARVLNEPVFQAFMQARLALHKVIAGESLRASYDEILSAKSDYLSRKGFRHLNIAQKHDRALLRLQCMRGTISLEQAVELERGFDQLPANARAILIHELNKDGVGDGWGTLPYYAPALFVNAHQALKNVSGGADRANTTTLLALARVLQEARILATGRGGDGVLTVNVEALARFVLTPEYKANPDSLLNQKLILFSHSGDPNQFGVRLTPTDGLDASKFAHLKSLADLPGEKIAVIGIGGGSDGIQAAQLALLLKASGKQIQFVGSVRTGHAGRTIENHDGEVVKGSVFRVGPGSSGRGRFLENIPAAEVPMYLILDQKPFREGSLALSINALIRSVGDVDTVITVDTGGDSLCSSKGEPTVAARATPDQDLRVLNEVAKLKVKNLVSTILAAGVDSPANAANVLLNAKARYYEFSALEARSILARYEAWDMQGLNPARFGKTPLAWQLALAGERGLKVIPLPSAVVTDELNPWNPFVHITASMSGMFFMPVCRHLEAIN